MTIRAEVKTTMDGSQSPNNKSDQLVALIQRELLRLSNQARTDAARIHGGGGFAARRADRFYSLFIRATFIIFFTIPTMMGGIYYVAIASSQYTTESYISLSAQSSGIKAALSGILGSGSSGHVLEVVEYIKSPNIITDISNKVDIQEIFSKDDIDFISRLESNAALEEKVEYWNKQIEISKQSFTSQIRIRLRAFTPEDSLSLHNSVLQAAESHINKISRAEQEKRVAEAQQGLKRAKYLYEDALEALRLAREELGILDAELTAKGYEEILLKLRESATTLERRIEPIRARNPSSPQLRQLVPQLEVIQGQINKYERIIASSDTAEGSLAASAAALQAREMDLEIARSEFISRAAILEAAKTEALEQAVFMQMSVRPALPEKSLYPKRWLSSLAVLGASLTLWLLIAGLGLLIRDNMT